MPAAFQYSDSGEWAPLRMQAEFSDTVSIATQCVVTRLLAGPDDRVRRVEYRVYGDPGRTSRAGRYFAAAPPAVPAARSGSRSATGVGLGYRRPDEQCRCLLGLSGAPDGSVRPDNGFRGAVLCNALGFLIGCQIQLQFAVE